MAISSTGINPMIAVQAGAEMAQGMFNAERKAAAYNALREIYGDQAGDPQAASQLSNMMIAQKKLPGELEAQGLTNQTTRQNLEFNALANPEKLTGLQLGNESKALDNDFTRQSMPSRVQLNKQAVTRGGQIIDQGEQNLRKGEVGLGDDQAERERTAAQGVMAAVEEQIEAGADPAQAFDRVMPQIAAMENVDPAQLRQLRERFVADPKGTIAAMKAYMGASRPNTAQMQAQAAQTRANAAAAKAAGKTAGSAGAASFTDYSKRDVPDLISGLIADGGDIDQAGDPGPLGRSLFTGAKNLGVNVNDAQHNLRTRIDTLKNRLGTHNLQAFRAQGLTFGQITEKEFTRLSEAVENLDPNQEPGRLKEALGRIDTMYKSWLSMMEAENPQLKAPAKKSGTDNNTDPAEVTRRKALLDKYR